jgi:hypothetical protein
MKIAFRTSKLSMPAQVFTFLPRPLFREICEQLQAVYAEQRRAWRSQLTVHDCKNGAGE